MKKERLKYLDVAKALGIFFVYFGHYGTAGGYGYPFAYYSIPLFFFLSGCSEAMGKDMPILEAIKKKVKTILIPTLSFAIISIIVASIDLNSYGGVVSWIKIVVKGCIRNEFFAGGLWFLTCLFVMSIFFIFLKQTKSKVFMVIISLILTAVAETILPNNPRSAPSWIWNIDSAMVYFIYYVLGYVLFPYMNKLIADKTPKANRIKMAIGFGATIYGGVIFLGRNLLGWLRHIPVVGIFQYAITTTIVIIFFITVALVLEEFKLLQQIGRDTLFLCGSEYILKNCIEYLFTSLGCTIQFATPLAVYVWVGFLLVVATKWVIPIEKVIFRKLKLI